MWSRLAVVSLTPLLLAGCSWLPNALNPVEWYRGVAGVAKEEDDTGSVRNTQNLAAGAKQPYPNLGSVPKPPDTALSAAEREKLQKGLIADRANARYSDEELRQGRAVPPLPGEPPAAATAAPPAGATPEAAQAPATGSGEAPPATSGAAPRRTPPTRNSATAPQESPLVTPAVRSTPAGEAAHAPPPAPPGAQQPPPKAQGQGQPSASRQLALVAPPSPPAAPATPSRPAVMRGPTDRRANVVLQAAEISFSGDSTNLADEDNRHLAEVAKLAKNADARLRVIGYMRPASGGDAAQRELQAFGTALDRANAVAQALTKLDVAANRITVQAAPELATAKSDAARVEVFLEY